MRNVLKGCVALTAMLVVSPYGWSQTRQSGQAARADTGKTMVDQLSKNGAGGPAPRRDLNGFWAGPSSARINAVPPMTPWGEEQFRTHKNHAQFSEAESNDPLKSCDPMGFPRNMLNLIRGVGFFQMSDRMILMSQYNRVWREIFTDGRQLPKDVGGTADDSPDPRWYGYSVGHWEGDYTFVVDSVGADERAWMDQLGHPRSNELRVQERFTRLDHNTLEMTVTINDPKAYTKPFEITKTQFKWLPEQEIREEFCVPSLMTEYLKNVAEPASDPVQ
jgi:hypothetical protein